MKKIQIVPLSKMEEMRKYLNIYLTELSQFDPEVYFDEFEKLDVGVDESWVDAVDEYYDYILNHTGYFAICGARGCIRACMNALEKTGRIENTFHNPFYKKKSWSLPLQPETLPTGVNPYREEYLDQHYPGIRENEYERKL